MLDIIINGNKICKNQKRNYKKLNTCIKLESGKRFVCALVINRIGKKLCSSKEKENVKTPVIKQPFCGVLSFFEGVKEGKDKCYQFN